MASDVCKHCHRQRDTNGVGNIFCHECSGIDQGPLSKSSLCHVLQRRRLKIVMDHDPTTLLPVQSSKEGSVVGESQDILDGSEGNRSRTNSRDYFIARTASKMSEISGVGDERKNSMDDGIQRSASAASSRRGSKASAANS